MAVSWLSVLLLWFTVDGSEIVAFLAGCRGPHQDSSRAGCDPRAGGRCAPLPYIHPVLSVRAPVLSSILMSCYPSIVLPSFCSTVCSSNAMPLSFRPISHCPSVPPLSFHYPSVHPSIVLPSVLPLSFCILLCYSVIPLYFCLFFCSSIAVSPTALTVLHFSVLLCFHFSSALQTTSPFHE